MADDINAYALNLGFNIQTATAIAAIKTISTQVQKIQTDIEAVSKVFSTQFRTAVDDVTASFTEQSKQLCAISGELKKHIKMTEDLRDLQDELQATRKIETTKHVEHKKLGEEIAGVWDKTKKHVKDTVLGFADMLIGLQAVKATFSAFIAEEVKFVTANYRVYGAQEEIIQQVNKTTVAYGAMRGRVLEAYTILGGMIRTSADDLGELAQQTQSYSLILGVGMKEMANWQRAMKGIGWGAQDAQIMLNRMVGTMRQLGMTAEQMQKQLNQQTDSAAVMARMFGKEGTKQLNEFNQSMVGVANALNLPMNQVNKMQDELGKAAADKEAVALFQSRADEMAGLTAKQWGAMTEGQQQAALMQSGLDQVVADAADQWKNMNGFQREYYLEAQGLGQLSADTMDALIKEREAYGSLAGAQDKASAVIEKLVGKMSEAEKAAYYEREATKNLQMEWTKAMSDMDAAWKDLWASLKPAAMWFINEVMKPIVHWLANVIRWFAGVARPVKQAEEAIDGLNKKAAPAVGTLEGIWNVVKGITGGFLAFTAAAVAVGGALVGLYFLWKKFMATLEVGKLLALAVAAIAVGAGFYLLAKSFETLAALGDKIWAPLVALVVILALVIGGLMLLSKAGPMVIVAALAIAVVMIAVAFAAKLMAEAFAIASDAILKLMEVNVVDLLLLGGALIVFGVLAGIAAITIGIGGAALWLASKPLSWALGNIGEAMSEVDPNGLNALGTALEKFGNVIDTAGPAIRDGAYALWKAPFGKACAALAFGIWLINIPDMIAVAGAMMVLGRSLELMSKYDTSMLPDVGANIASFARGLSQLGADLGMAVWSIAFAWIPLSNAFSMLILVIPVINRVMTAIADAIQAGIDRIDSKMRGMISMLSPLEMIMASLGLPIRALALENIPGRVVSETVQTVQVKGDEVGAGSLERRETSENQIRQLDILTSMNDKIGKISSASGGDDVRGIKALLTEYLPKMAASPSKLGTKMSDWGS